jgi:hypothetical protein
MYLPEAFSGWPGKSATRRAPQHIKLGIEDGCRHGPTPLCLGNT